jgi:DNA-binding transcriptional LysR family regulator
MKMRTLRAVVEVMRQGGFSQAEKVVLATPSTVIKAVSSSKMKLAFC